MSTRLTQWLAPIAFQCAACGTDFNPYNIQGQVQLREFPDGGSEIFVVAAAQRPVGASVQSLDAGIALNGVPLGEPDNPGTLEWTRPALPGAGHGLEQTLSVIGSVPEATAKFTCPGPVAFTAPDQGASLDRNQPVHVAWSSQDGGAAPAMAFGFSLENPPPGTLGLFGIQLLPPPGTSAEFILPAEITQSDARVRFSVIVPGPSASDSYCASVPFRTVLFP